MSNNIFNIKDDWLYIPSLKAYPTINIYPAHGYPTSLSDALIAQAKCIYNDFKDRRLAITLSGGVDSHQVAYGFAKANLPVKYVYFSFTYENRPEKERIFVDDFIKKFDVDVDVIEYNFTKQSFKEFLMQIKSLSKIGYNLLKLSYSDYLKEYPDTMFVSGSLNIFYFLRNGNVCYGSLNLNPHWLEDSYPFENSILIFQLYSTHLFEYFEYLHRKDKIMQFHKKFQPKNLAFTELGFPLRQKLGNCDWQTDNFHTPLIRTSIDFAYEENLRALEKDRRHWFLTEIFNYSNDRADEFISKKLRRRKLKCDDGLYYYDSTRYINLYSFETDVDRYDL